MNSPDTIALFGCKSTTKFILKFLLRHDYKVVLITIDPEKGKSQRVADYTSLKNYCKDNGVETYICQNYNLGTEKDFAFFHKYKFQIGFVVGWQRLIPGRILDTFQTGVFGMHGSAMNLPKGRGRSPMNWSIIEGRKVFYTNLFKYKSGVDDGDVLDTFKFQIRENDTGETMHFKNTLAMKFLIEKNISSLLQGNFVLTKQPPYATPTYYPKRNESDSLIDWGDDIVKIERLIRAVTDPFNGAYSFINDNKIILWRANIFDFQEFGFDHASPGEVVAVYDNGKFLVKAYGGLLLVHEYETSKTIKPGYILTNYGETKKVFPVNRYGFYDIEPSDPEI